jgi:hypothetical protein
MLMYCKFRGNLLSGGVLDLPRADALEVCCVLPLKQTKAGGRRKSGTGLILLFWNFLKNTKIIDKNLFFLPKNIGFFKLTQAEVQVDSFLILSYFKHFKSILPSNTTRSFSTLAILIRVNLIQENISN